MMDLSYLLLSVGSVLLAAQSAYSTALMLYAWEDDEKRGRNRVPTTYAPPKHSFTILLPARHEETVIQNTIQRVVDLRYPRELVQVLVVIEAGDSGTIAKVNEKLAALAHEGVKHVRLITFADPPINKPHGLNVGLTYSTGDVVTIFDAEDEPHQDILHVVNTVMTNEGVPVVQCGVQWFKSRMHYHAAVGMVPLGGNTVFIRRDLLKQMNGWDQYCLTEDADIGIQLSAARVVIRLAWRNRPAFRPIGLVSIRRPASLCRCA